MIFLKRSKRRRPKAEFIIGARWLGIRPMEPGIGARCIGIRAIERGMEAPRVPIRCTGLPWPIICAVAVKAAKAHAATQPRRRNFLQFIAYRLSKDSNPRGSKVAALEKLRGNERVIFSRSENYGVWAIESNPTHDPCTSNSAGKRR
jgi:hypothetical protein